MSGLIRSLLLIAVLGLSVTFVKAATIDGTPPTINSMSVTGTPLTPAQLTTLNNDILAAWTSIKNQINLDLAKYDNQDKLAKGFANANAYTTSAATTQGYQDYSLFSLTTGFMIGIQLPEFTVNRDYVEKIRYKIESDGDAYVGAGVGIAIVNAGINAGFIIPGLYVNLKYGYYSIDCGDINKELEGLLYKTTVAGIGLNQIILWPRSIVPGAAKWRGISICTGFYYNKTEAQMDIIKPLRTSPLTVPGFPAYTGALIIDPTFTLKINTTTMTVPLDITTSFQLFYILNFNLGAGVDFTYGKSDVILKAAGNVTTDIANDPDITADITPGNVRIDGGTKDKKPSPVNPKITTGIGFNFSVVKIDIPVTIYIDSGFAVGITAGVVW